MKTLIISSLAYILKCTPLLAEEPRPFRPATDGIQEDLNPPPEPAWTPDELATPPAGQIQKGHLRTVNNLRDLLAPILAAVPAGANGTGSPWFAKAQAYKAGLDTVAASSLQSDCFALIPQIAALLEARKGSVDGGPVPEFASEAAGLANGFSTVLINAMERNIIDNNYTIPAANLARFCTVFSVDHFTAEGDWEASPIPVDPVALMIMDPAAVTTHMKTRPWQEVDKFLGGPPVADYFERYLASGNGMATLKTKYAANKAVIDAKWQELTAWLAAHRPPASE